MKRVLVLAAALCGGIAGAATAEDKAALAEEGKGVIKEFGGALQAELKAALQEKGPAYAVDVCNISAPKIAERVSGERGWSVARSSHKLRNQSNAPDAYTAAVIDEFLARQAAGETAENLVKADIVEENGERVFHLVKAIPTGEVCLTCHGGDEVPAAVVEELARLYPEDQARGFTLGEMRGVFTLSKKLN